MKAMYGGGRMEHKELTMAKDECGSPIVFYCMSDLAQPEVFCRRLAERFRQSGHAREIEFRVWDCYAGEPARDGDVFTYDGMVMSTLAARGFLRRLPDIIDIHNVFDWIHSGSWVGKRIYGLPFMLCGAFLICRRREYRPDRNVFALEGGVTTTLRDSILPYLYLYAFCCYQDAGENSLAAVQRLYRSFGGASAFAGSEAAREENVRRFCQGEYRYILGFSEDLRLLAPDDYAIELIDLSERPRNELPLLYCDYVSLGRRATGEKLLDCLDLMEIIADPDFVYEVCTAGGEAQYMLPADRTVYPRLATLDPIYRDLCTIAGNPDNCVLRYARDFYDDFHGFEEDLLRKLAVSAGDEEASTAEDL